MDKEINTKKRTYIYIGIIILLIIAIIGVSFAFFNYTRTGPRNTLQTGNIVFNYVDGSALTLSNQEPIGETEATTGDSNKISFSITSHNTLPDGIKYSVYAVYGDEETGKTRFPDSVVSLKFVPAADGDGFTTKTNNYETASNLTFTNGKALISTGIVKDTIAETTKNYEAYIWIDETKVFVSSTTKRATLPEGNPSLADATTGNVTAGRYIKNDNNLVNTTLYPATTENVNKIIYTTKEYSNSYYSIKIVVEAEDYVYVTGTDKVRAAIKAKETATTNQCNPTWVDDMGTENTSDDITYFSGTNTCVDMNYVWYSGKLWRITAIYPDGAMKLVTENNITSIAFNESSSSDATKANFYNSASDTSYMYQWLNEDFYDTLYNAEEFIDTTKKWNATMPADTNISTKPLETNMVSANVGLLNSYEYYNSYRCIGSTTCAGSISSTSYLNIGYYWWLLNPYNSSSVWYVLNVGGGMLDNPSLAYGGRPSIYLKSGLEFTGNGTTSEPYKIVGDKDAGSVNDYVNTRLSGEYVKLKNGNNEQLFRIIDVEDNKTKIIAMDYADNKATRKFATSSSGTLWGSGTTTDTDTWYTYLNNTYLPNLKTTYNELFDSGMYYFGTSGYNYKLSVCANTTSGNTKECAKTTQSGTFNIGLPRYGEMFATQQSGGTSNSIHMWLINRFNASLVWFVNDRGNAALDYPTYTYGGRPTLHLKSTVKILSCDGDICDGTQNHPYVVGL